jgi:hypothetical protein
MDEIETGSLPCFTAVPLNGTLNTIAPSNGTFVASNVRTQECTPSEKAEILALHVIQEDDVAILCIPSYIGEVYIAFDDRAAVSKSRMLLFRYESKPHYP